MLRRCITTPHTTRCMHMYIISMHQTHLVSNFLPSTECLLLPRLIIEDALDQSRCEGASRAVPNFATQGSWVPDSVNVFASCLFLPNSEPLGFWLHNVTRNADGSHCEFRLPKCSTLSRLIWDQGGWPMGPWFHGMMPSSRNRRKTHQMLRQLTKLSMSHNPLGVMGLHVPYSPKFTSLKKASLKAFCEKAMPAAAACKTALRFDCLRDRELHPGSSDEVSHPRLLNS